MDCSYFPCANSYYLLSAIQKKKKKPISWAGNCDLHSFNTMTFIWRIYTCYYLYFLIQFLKCYIIVHLVEIKFYCCKRKKKLYIFYLFIFKFFSSSVIAHFNHSLPCVAFSLYQFFLQKIKIKIQRRPWDKLSKLMLS